MPRNSYSDVALTWLFYPELVTRPDPELFRGARAAGAVVLAIALSTLAALVLS